MPPRPLSAVSLPECFREKCAAVFPKEARQSSTCFWEKSAAVFKKNKLRIRSLPSLRGSIRIGTTLAALLLGPQIAAANPPAVVATSKPAHTLVAQVMKGVATPGLVVDGGASPHTYALRPSDAQRLAKADIVIRMSEAVEPFTARAVKSLPKTVAVVTLADTPGLRRLPRRTSATFERESHAGHGHGHKHAAKPKPGDDIDGHVWLDTANAQLMLDHLAEQLAARDAANAGTYRANAATSKAAIAALETDIAAMLAPAAGVPFVVFHDALQYFDQRYRLNAVGSITTNPEIPPSGKRLTELRKKLQGLDAACVFAEPNFEMRVVQSVVEGTKARTAVLDPEGTTIAAGPTFYADLMRRLATTLKSCLVPSG